MPWFADLETIRRGLEKGGREHHDFKGDDIDQEHDPHCCRICLAEAALNVVIEDATALQDAIDRYVDALIAEADFGASEDGVALWTDASVAVKSAVGDAYARLYALSSRGRACDEFREDANQSPSRREANVSARIPFPEIDTTASTGYEWFSRWMQEQASVAANNLFCAFKLGQIGVAARFDRALAAAMLDDFRTERDDLKFAAAELVKVMDSLIDNIARNIPAAANSQSTPDK